MSLFTNPPTTTKYGFQKGDTHLGVWAIQVFLGARGIAPFTDSKLHTGYFGDLTEKGVRKYQALRGITVDGKVGPQTQAKIVADCVPLSPYAHELPSGLIEGLIHAESGLLLAAANSSVPGGIDLGLTQRRVYGPPFSEAAVKDAMNPVLNVSHTIANGDHNGLYDRYLTYSARVGKGEHAWRLAALAHNWPWAAETLSRGGTLSTTTRATWVPRGTKFRDGAPVVSYRDWAEFYALGSKAHNDPGMVTALAFPVPSH